MPPPSPGGPRPAAPLALSLAVLAGCVGAEQIRRWPPPTPSPGARTVVREDAGWVWLGVWVVSTPRPWTELWSELRDAEGCRGLQAVSVESWTRHYGLWSRPRLRLVAVCEPGPGTGVESGPEGRPKPEPAPIERPAPPPRLEPATPDRGRSSRARPRSAGLSRG